MAVPHGRTGGGGKNDKGSFDTNSIPEQNIAVWKSTLVSIYNDIKRKHPQISDAKTIEHLGTLGTGNHFIEVSLDERNDVWVMLHSGSRGVGNKIGTYFIELAKKDVHRLDHTLPDMDLAYFNEGTQYFNDYVQGNILQ